MNIWKRVVFVRHRYMVKYLFAAIGVSGKTNHSLCATGASELYRSNVSEKLSRTVQGIVL